MDFHRNSGEHLVISLLKELLNGVMAYFRKDVEERKVRLDFLLFFIRKVIKRMYVIGDLYRCWILIGRS